jgi:hypothetical protein
MAATAGRAGDNFNIFGTVPVSIDTFIPDTSYPTGGYAVTGALWGLASAGGPGATSNGIIGLTQISVNTAAALYQLVYNEQTGKVQILTAGAEVANATDLHTLIFGVIVYAAGE